MVSGWFWTIKGDLDAGAVSVRGGKSGIGTVKCLVFINIYRFRGTAVPQLCPLVPPGVPRRTAGGPEEHPGNTDSRKMLPPGLNRGAHGFHLPGKKRQNQKAWHD